MIKDKPDPGNSGKKFKMKVINAISDEGCDNDSDQSEDDPKTVPAPQLSETVQIPTISNKIV